MKQGNEDEMSYEDEPDFNQKHVCTLRSLAEHRTTTFFGSLKMRQLHKSEFLSVSAGCSACQQHNLSVMVATFNGTILGMAVTGGLFMLPVSAPVAIGSGVLAFASASYYSYFNTLDSFKS